MLSETERGQAPAGIGASEVEARARRSAGISAVAIYRMVAQALTRRGIRGGVFADIGCGRGDLWPFVAQQFDRYVGSDVVRYDGLPDAIEFHRIDLDTGRIPLADASADVVAAVETIEHLENPRAFVRELVRLAKPEGWVLVTTPNQRSLLSLLTLVVKGHFAAFQDVHYPAHLTALLDVDLRRIAAESGLVETEVAYSGSGRLVLTPLHYPSLLARALPRALSDNLMLIGRKRGG
ncbi:MAG: methyltransferase domain-containing protein [Gemmatimonadaceae bacterium]